jgi:DDB1- and CUL4-associated factor 7
MPFHSYHHHGSQGSIPNVNPPGAASGLYQAAQALGSIGAPTGNLRVATTGQTAAGTDSLMPSSGSAPGYQVYHDGGQTAPPASSGFAHPPNPSSASASSGSASNSQVLPSLTASHRSQTLGREGPELHIPSNAPSGHSGPSYGSPHGSQHDVFHSPNEYSAGGDTPNYNIPQVNPPTSHNPSSRQDSNIPGALQAGGSGRPAPPSSYTAPSTVPTVPQISTNAQQYSLPSRSSTLNASHAYSRSSPAGLEQKYIPFSSNAGTPENTKYIPPQSQKYYNAPLTPTGAASQSPLVLADIRPRGNSTLEDVGGPLFNDREERLPTNSNYLAPWAVYAYDWCKWQVHGGNSAGKMAIASYLEDPHNFVSSLFARHIEAVSVF